MIAEILNHTDRQNRQNRGGSGKWIPFASFCTTGQFMHLGKGYIRHCGPTAAVNVIRTLENYSCGKGGNNRDGRDSRNSQDGRNRRDGRDSRNSQDGRNNRDGRDGRNSQDGGNRRNSQDGGNSRDGIDRRAREGAANKGSGNPRGQSAHNEKTDWRKACGNDPVSLRASRDEAVKKKEEDLFLLCAGIGVRTRIYWNTEIMGRFGGTSNPLTGLYLRRCLRAAGLRSLRSKIRFHILISPDAVEEALNDGAIVYLQVYRHPKYRDHHMLCYGCRYTDGRREFLLADGWAPRPVWTDDKGIGHGHFLTIQCGDDT